MPRRRRRFLSLWMFSLAVLLSAVAAATAGAQAPAAGKVLMLGSSVGGEGSVYEQQAVADGFDVDVVDDATWSSMTTAQFAAYRAIVIGDWGEITAAEGNTAAWGPAVTGNILLSSGDEGSHAS